MRMFRTADPGTFAWTSKGRGLKMEIVNISKTFRYEIILTNMSSDVHRYFLTSTDTVLALTRMSHSRSALLYLLKIIVFHFTTIEF